MNKTQVQQKQTGAGAPVCVREAPEQIASQTGDDEAISPPDDRQAPDRVKPGGVTVRAANPKRCRGDLKQDFERWYAIYPKKRNRAQAERAFLSISPDAETVDVMINATQLASQSREWRKDGGQFIPYPATWLRAQGWLDDYAPPHIITEAGTAPTKPRTMQEIADYYSEAAVRLGIYTREEMECTANITPRR